jgi:hypothetical protein
VARLVRDEPLGWDIDVPTDLDLPDHLRMPSDIAALLAAAEAPCR